MFYKERGILALKNYTTYSQKRKNKKKSLFTHEAHRRSYELV